MLNLPSFWYSQKTAREKFLRSAFMPLSWVYGWLVKKRFELYFPVPMEKPIICVGNLVAGGAGKTPVVMSLIDAMKDKGYNPHILTRGYGGEEEGPVQVSPSRDTAHYVGDEALLLVNKAPTWVSRNRALGAQVAMDSGANIIVMDDGFQNPAIFKDFSILVIDGKVGFGNRNLMPAGPLREPIDQGISRAQALVIIGEDMVNTEEKLKRIDADLMVIHASIKPSNNNLDIKDKKLSAFAGIGRPEKFKDTLEAEGAEVAAWKSFPDHYEFKEEDLEQIVKDAEDKGLTLITTAKDHVRVPEKFKEKIATFNIELEWHDNGCERILNAIEARIKDRHV